MYSTTVPKKLQEKGIVSTLRPLILFPMSKNKKYPIEKSEKNWKAELSPEEFKILREKGTEYPFTGQYNDHYEEGTYLCKGCGTPLYKSENKFDSHCGWPSYDKSIEGALEMIPDHSAGWVRTEIVCANCGGHQGHVFNDGPTKTGLRYCVNSASINFIKKPDQTIGKK
jgi:peptide-methionine (R)-S-oxide reductase